MANEDGDFRSKLSRIGNDLLEQLKVWFTKFKAWFIGLTPFGRYLFVVIAVGVFSFFLSRIGAQLAGGKEDALLAWGSICGNVSYETSYILRDFSGMANAAACATSGNDIVGGMEFFRHIETFFGRIFELCVLILIGTGIYRWKKNRDNVDEEFE